MIFEIADILEIFQNMINDILKHAINNAIMIYILKQEWILGG
jgi:hypothetical protein